MMKHIAIILVTTLFLTSCATFKAPNFSTIKIGMSQEQVIAQLGKNYTVVTVKKYEDGVLEILQFPISAKIYGSGPPYNWFFFFNNQLDEWGKKENYAPFDYHNDFRQKRNRN